MIYVVTGILVFAAILAMLSGKTPHGDNQRDIEAARRKYERNCQELIREQEARKGK